MLDKSKEDHSIETDVAIIGGGVAGLWLLNILRAKGFSVILLETVALGADQTNKSQGIIHGGIKYALQGETSKASTAIAAMPSVWKACLQGTGALDLSGVPILSSQQYLWSTGSITSKLASFFAPFALKNQISKLAKNFYPSIFQSSTFKGEVFSLNELVIDAHLLIRELMKGHQDVIFKIDPMKEQDLVVNHHHLESLRIKALPMHPLKVKAKKYIFTAGNGNELILKKLNMKEVGIQRRPLHMVLMKDKKLPLLYAHCLGLSATPRLTITTHKTWDDQWVWYMGGQLAEEGVTRSEHEQIDVTKRELKTLFPWHDFKEATFASFFVNRAENKEPRGNRPHSFFMKAIGNIIIAWPTKLALAPALVDAIYTHLSSIAIKSGMSDLREARAWPIPSLAKPIWDQLL